MVGLFYNLGIKYTKMITFKQFILLEGGNVFKNADGTSATTSIKKSDVFKVVDDVSEIVRINLLDNLLGSTGKKEVSGDIDIGALKSQKDTIYNDLLNYCKKNNLDDSQYVRRTGAGIHFKAKIPGTDEYAQVDFLFVNNLDFAKFFLANNESLPYKGVHRNIVLACLAKARNLKFLSGDGLITRDASKIVSTDPDEIAKIILDDDTATSNDLFNIPSIISKLKEKLTPEEIKELLQDAQKTLTTNYNVALNI